MNAESSFFKASSRRLDHPLAPILFISGIGVLLLLALRPGQEWDGDFALYLMNARNISLGLPYGKTAYLLNPDNPINPAAYPPGLPLLFAPMYALFGIDLTKLKILCIAALVLFLIVFYKIARESVPRSFALAVTALIGLHPSIVELESSVASEFPFFLFCYSALYLLNRCQQQDRVGSPSSAPVMVLAAIAVAFAYVTRSIGVLIFPASFVVSLLDTRRLLTRANAVLAAAAVLIALAQLAFPADLGTYVQFFDDFSLNALRVGVLRYWGVVRMTLLGQMGRDFPLLGSLLGAGILVLTAVGFVDHARRRLRIFEAFFAIYVCFVIVYPVTTDVSRYSMPVWPLLFLYSARAIDLCRRYLGAVARYALPVTAFLLFASLYAVQYANAPFGEVPYSVEARPSEELFEALKAKLPADARVLSRKPTIIGLYTGHEAMIWPMTFTDAELWSFLDDRHIDYIVQDVTPLGVHAGWPDPLAPFIERNRDRLDLVFHNDWFNVYKSLR